MALLNRDEPWVLSEGDLELLPHYKTSKLNDILFELGMDVKRGYEEQVCTHRSSCTNIIYEDGRRFFGVERSDVQHLRNKGINI